MFSYWRVLFVKFVYVFWNWLMDETRGLPYTQQLYSRFCKKSFNFHLLNFSIQFCFSQRFGVSKIKISLTTQYYNALLQFENCTLLECARLLNEYAHSTPPRRSPKYTIGRENGKKKTNRSPPPTCRMSF